MRRTAYMKTKKRHLRMKRFLLGMITAISAALTIYGGLLLYAQMTGAPSLSVAKASVFLDENGKVIGDYAQSERRYWVDLDKMSPFLIDAAIATEDQKFYSHNGFNYKRIAAALLKDIKNRRMVEGASTITQQYARNLHLSHTKTWKRKIEEALIAFRLERFYDKETILEGYLNTIYFGHGMYGVEAASNFYFDKSAKELTLEESAVILAIAKGPTIYSPINYPENSKRRKEIVLTLMASQDFISEEQKDRALSMPITLKNESWQKDQLVAPYFLDEVWKEAEQILADNGRYAAEGGWTIRTTLNLHHQQTAEEVTEKWMPENELQIGFVSMHPETGAISSLVGGREYYTSPFNRVTQAKRQPGSVMKPILYAAALESGFSPLTFLLPEKTVFTYDDGRESYSPKNINGKFATHPISLAQAIAVSDNVYAVKTLEEIGYDKFQKMVERLGIQTKLPVAPSIALGTTEVSLLDMTSAYNKIAAQGIDVVPHTILSISDSEGKTVYERKPKKSKRVVTEEDAFVLTHLMTGMFDPVFNDYLTATGVSMRQKQTRPYAAKSGTTESDQYLIGYSPSLTAGVWNGYDIGKNIDVQENQSVTKNIWIEFMEKVHSGKTPEPFVPPAGVNSVIVDIETGGLAVSDCSKQRLMYLKEKDLPQKLCTDPALQEMHQSGSGDENKKFNLFPFSFFD